MPYLLHIYSNCYADKTMNKEICITQQIISGETLSKESKRTSLCWAVAVSVNQLHPQLNGTKSVELEIVYALVHLLNEGGLYKMDKKIYNY